MVFILGDDTRTYGTALKGPFQFSICFGSGRHWVLLVFLHRLSFASALGPGGVVQNVRSPNMRAGLNRYFRGNPHTTYYMGTWDPYL